MNLTEQQKIRIGASAWSFDDWKGAFYPPDLPESRWLEFYARFFPAIEVDTTFYAAPSEDTVRRWMDSGQIPAARTSGGRRRVDGAALAQFSVERAQSPTLQAVAESARNHFPGLVTKVTKDKVMAQVELQAGPFRVVSLMSREAADELALVPGVLAVASVKATNVIVELPAED